MSPFFPEEGKPPALIALRPRPGTRSAPPAEDATLIKERDKVLTLTAQEAVTLGLAIGIVANPGTVGPTLKIDRWHEAGDGATKVALAAYKTAEESSKEIGRLDAILSKALTTAIGGNAATLTRQLGEHKAAKLAATRLAKIIEASPYYSGMIDASSLDLAINAIDRRITHIEALIERERKK